ncbi:efflux RND transporter periplasmic adaptor subunit [Azospirillum sp. RWY-5-1]|uniref:Efflux RND transporter periplasmic adaptor subunit n=1 Tax=Azospirillum oleiclasticum TaxID=2735135 RepID=A0ABX2TL55_9PROT|nr:efflux RND transporter periplasmic adaptor subunit [Azospirillum oleiclasticum]NYZ16464.1 efflux RND transporter periplasmic adaptor subunit [Azospirillum oleiclasticum]NYZ24066.1 efflux RND transporter periplasmic adaptor subunit [Azospirillum oleiclasticum]
MIEGWLVRRWAIALVAATLALTTATAASAQAPGGGQGAPLPAVVVAPVERRTIAPQSEFVGRVEPIASFDARVRVAGTLERVAFAEGQDVVRDQLLYVIEPAVYRARLDAAQAQLARAEAQLREATQDYERAVELNRRGTASEATLQQSQAARDSAQADVMAARAAVEQAELELSYTDIRSPIVGRVGATAVTEGNYVTPETGTLATVVQLDPIRVVFSVSDRQLLDVLQQTGAGSPAELTDRFVPTLRMANGTLYDQPGRVEFVDNRVDPQTGTIRVRARFTNPQALLLPGQYVNVVVRPEQTAQRPVVPVDAVQRNREGAYVLVVGADDVVQARPVTLGTQQDQVYAVRDGLQPGERIVVQGQQKLRPGMRVNPVSRSAEQEEKARREQGAAGSSVPAPAVAGSATGSPR